MSITDHKRKVVYARLGEIARRRDGGYHQLSRDPYPARIEVLVRQVKDTFPVQRDFGSPSRVVRLAPRDAPKGTPVLGRPRVIEPAAQTSATARSLTSRAAAAGSWPTWRRAAIRKSRSTALRARGADGPRA